MKNSLLSIFITFLKLGINAWGGPTAQLSLIYEKFVEKEKLIKPEEFNKTLGLYQALPGPEAFEMCVYVGSEIKGKFGGLLAGLGYALPGFIIVTILSYIYKIYGATVFSAAFVGIQPAVSAIIVRAVYKIGSKLVTDITSLISAYSAAVLTYINFNLIVVIIICAVFSVIDKKISRKIGIIFLTLILCSFISFKFYEKGTIMGLGAKPVALKEDAKLDNIFLYSLKAGLLSFGGAYSTIPILKEEMVEKRILLEEKTFLDGLGIISIVPTPVIMFAAFLGFMTLGIAGALIGAIGILLPAILIAVAGHKKLQKIVNNENFSDALNGVAAAVAGILLITAIEIILANVRGYFAIFIFILTVFLMLKLNKSYIIPLCILVSGLLGLGFTKLM